MREFSVPAVVSVGERENLADVVFEHAANHPDGPLYRRRDASGSWVPVSAARFASEVTRIAAGLIAAGVEHGDRVALLSRTRYEWTLFDYAILTAGAVTVPIYETSSPDQIQWILSDSGAVAVVVENDDHTASVEKVRSATPTVRHAWQIDPSSSAAGAPGAVEQLTGLGSDVTDADVEARRTAVRSDELCTLIYTSGTTGRPKGCELTHRNMVYETRTVCTLFPDLLNQDSEVLLFLPLAHVFAKAIQCGSLQARAVVGHSPDVKNLLADLADFRPTLLLAVPRVFEKVYNGARLKAHGDGKGKIFDAAAETAIAYSRALDDGGPGLLLRARHALFDKLVYGKLRAATGGRVAGAVSASAPLGPRLGHFFRGIGLPVLEGYGLTETSAGVTINTTEHQRIGSVGRPFPGCAVRIAEDGEIMLSGPVVYSGYWHNEQATAEAVEPDGWFHSGDIGELDDAGYLTITGRKKELIVTAGGKNVAPAVLEDRLRAHPLVGQCLVVGDQKPFIAALVTIDPEALPGWRERNGKPAGDGGDAGDLVDDPELRGEIAAAVEEANQAVSRAEQIRKFRILPNDFSETGGELTPTLKVKRNVVVEKYTSEIEAVYETAGQKG